KQIDILRQTAHQLEETAHQLECCEQFERADQVRQLAEMLRQDARPSHKNTETTAASSLQPAAASLDQAQRAALRARYHRTPIEAIEAEQLEIGLWSDEPSCPACPAEAKRRAAASSTIPVNNQQ